MHVVYLDSANMAILEFQIVVGRKYSIACGVFWQCKYGNFGIYNRGGPLYKTHAFYFKTHCTENFTFSWTKLF